MIDTTHSGEDHPMNLLTRGEDVWYSESVDGKQASGIYKLHRRQPLSDVLTLPCLLAAVVVVGWTGWGSPVMTVPLLIVGGLLLRRRELAALIVASAVVVIYATVSGHVFVADWIVVAASAAIAARMSRQRSATGVHGMRGASMLTELHARLNAPRTVKPPKGWGLKTVVRRPRGQFTGSDFIVSHRDGDRLELAVVDVSGKGMPATMRATSLAGAFDGIIGSVPPGEFLAACNRYLLRNGHDDTFVSAAHLTINFATGAYTITCAGHLPPVKLDTASGAWRTSPARGVALGVIPDADYAEDRGVLAAGEALMVFSDGLLGSRDPDEGTDRLLGEADCLLGMGMAAGAAHLARQVSGTPAGDGAFALLWRAAATDRQ